MINVRKIAKRITATAVAAATVIGISASVNAYSLKYITSAPSSVQTMTQTDSATATGKQQIEIYSSKFEALYSGAYVNAYSTNFSTYSVVISNRGSYHIDYKGNTVPKNGALVYVKFELENYFDSKTVEAAGSMSA